MMRSLSWIAVAGVLASTPGHAATEAKVLEQSSAWTLDYAEERCSLIRTFGTGNDAIKLQIDSYGSPVDFRALLSGKRIPRPYGPTGEIRYGFPVEPVERDRTGSLHGTAGNMPSVSFGISFLPYEPKAAERDPPLAERLAEHAVPVSPAPEFERQIRSLVVEFTSRRSVQLNLGNMAAPLAAIRSCLDDLKKHWGLDPEQERTLSRHPIADASSVKRLQRNYPASMSAMGQSALVPVRVMVDASGQSTACVVQVPSVEQAFKEAVCDRLAQRFSPALDKDGQPVASVYRATVIFQMPS